MICAYSSGGEAPSSGCDSKRQYGSIQNILKNYGDHQLYSDMQTYWPSDAGPDDTFWVHEWGKHGKSPVTTIFFFFPHQSAFHVLVTTL